MYITEIIEELEKDIPDLDLVTDLLEGQKTHVADIKMKIIEIEVCKVYGITYFKFKSRTRKTKVIWARHVCFSIRRKKKETFESIARSFKLDHATVHNGLKKSKILLSSGDKEYTALYNQAMKRINQLNIQA